jgi:hypothetical protein
VGGGDADTFRARNGWRNIVRGGGGGSDSAQVDRQRSPRKLLAAVVRKLVTADAAISLRQSIGPTAPGPQ